MDKEIAEQVLAWMKEGIEAVQTQAPQLAQEMIRYGLLCYLTCLIIGGVFIWLAFKCHRLNFEDSYSDEFREIVIPALAILLALIGSFTVVWNALGILSILLAPKLYVLGELTSTLKAK